MELSFDNVERQDVLSNIMGNFAEREFYPEITSLNQEAGEL